MSAEQRTSEINRMIREQGAAKELLDVGYGRMAQLWHDDALTEECLLRLEGETA